MSKVSSNRLHNTNAYLIQGHGLEGTNTFIVPPGCIIIVKMKTGERGYYPNNLIHNLCSLSPTILKNPIMYRAELYRLFGSVAIYTPGQICSNFQYTLLQCFRSEEPFTFCSSYGSGVNDIDLYLKGPKKQCKRANSIKNVSQFERIEKSKNIHYIYRYIGNLFKHSIIPTAKEVLDYVDVLIDQNITTLPEILSKINKKYKTTQEELCRTKPGIYYNFICRANKATSQLFTMRENNHRNILHNDIESILSIISKEKQNKKEELSKIDENIGKMETILQKAQQEYEIAKKPFNKMENDYELAQNTPDTNKNTLQKMYDTLVELEKSLERKAHEITLLRDAYIIRKANRSNKQQNIEEFKPISNRLKTLKSHIGEAEVHRKSGIRNIFTPAYINERRQKEYKNLELHINQNQKDLEEYRRRIKVIQEMISLVPDEEEIHKKRIKIYEDEIDKIEHRLHNAKRTKSFLKKEMESLTGGYIGKYTRKQNHINKNK